MNHIYKVIWNHAKHCYTVVSEIAKNHSTSSVTKKKVSIAVILAAGMLSGFSPMVSGAADTTNSEAVVYDQNQTSLKSTNSGSVGKNAIALGKGASAVDDSIAIGNGASVVGGSNGKGGVALGKNAHAGYKGTSLGNSAISGREGTIVIGDTTNASSLYSTVVGTNSTITSDNTAYTLWGKSVIVQGAVSTSYGASNTITNTEKVFSGVANSISGSANTVTNSNGVTIQGTGNTVSNAYKDMNISIFDLLDFRDGDYSSLAKKDSGAIAIIGGGNTISDQLSSTVIGFGNTLKGENSTGVFTAGSHNKLTNVSNSLVMGDKNTLEDRKNVISLGNENTVDADDAVAIGNGTTVTAKSGVAIGVGSVADRVAGSEKGALGAFAPDTIPKAEESTWRSTAGAVSVGDTVGDITRQITNVAAGSEDTDAVNVAQLKQVAGQAEKANQGWNLSTNGEATAATNVAPGGYVDFSGDDNVSVSNKETQVKVALNKDVKLNSATFGNTVINAEGLTIGGGTSGLEFSKTRVSVGGQQIHDVADGKEDMDAVNMSQLKKQAAASKTTVSAGTNTTVTSTVAEDGHTDYKVNLNKDLTGIESMTNGLSSIRMGNGGTVTINNRVTIDQSGKISGVAAGEVKEGSTDAVNGSQLKQVASQAEKANQGWNLSTNGEATAATNVAPGGYVDFSGDDNVSVSNEETKVKVALNKDINVNSVQTNALNSKYNLSVGTAADNGKMPFFVNSNGAFYAAGGEFVVEKDGSVKATSGDIGNVKLNNGVFYKNSALRDGELYVGDADGNYSQITSKNAKLGKVTIDDTGRISGVVAGRIAADSTDAVNGSQLHEVATEAGKHSKVVNGSNINVEETDVDGQKIYKVGLNDDILLGKLTGNNVSISGTNGTIETTGYIATKDRIIADKGAQLADITVSGNAISNGEAKVALDGAAGTAGMINGKGASIYMQDGYTVINSKVAFDQNGKISGVAAGTADTDAVNVSQLKAVGTTANMGWNLATNGVATEATNVKPGEYVDFSGDKNISVSHDGTKVKVELNKDIDVNSVQTNALNSKYNLSVGTMGGDGKTGFFVNSNGAFYGAKGDFVVDKDGGVTATSGNIGNVTLNNGVFYKNSALRDGELYVGDNKGNYSQITSTNAKLGKVVIDETGKITGVAAGKISADSTDAVNGSQLHEVATEAGKHSKVVNGSNINVEETDVDGQKIYKVGLNDDILLGKLTGNNVSISGTNGTIETTGYIATKDRIIADKGAQLADITVSGNAISNGEAKVALDGAAGTAGMINGKGASLYMQDGTTVINNKVGIDQEGKITGVAAGEISATSKDAVNGSQLKQTNDKVDALDKRVTQNEADIKQNKADIAQNKADIAQNKADIQKNTVAIEQNKTDIATNKESINKLDTRVTNVEELAKKHTTVAAGDNITVTEGTNKDGGKNYTVAMKKDITVDSVKAGDTTINTEGVRIGDTTSLKKDSLTIGGKTYVTDKGLNANDQKVTKVAAGDISEKSTDAVNGSQLFATNQQVVQNAQSINKLGNRVNKVGAGAAALAALHPLDFDPDDKWDFAAGYGNYNGENAAAIGAYYRPNEDTMFSVGGSFGNGENMVNAGVSLKLGQGNHVSTSKVAMAKEIKDLRKELEGLKSALLDVNAGKKLDTSKLQLFPDVPKNHWAYEYVSTLKGNGVLTGYPDGEFKGDRPMTRYEFATMLYKAMLEGATLSDKILKEFAPELERFTVDTVHQDKDGKPTVERVRTVKAEK